MAGYEQSEPYRYQHWEGWGKLSPELQDLPYGLHQKAVRYAETYAPEFARSLRLDGSGPGSIAFRAVQEGRLRFLRDELLTGRIDILGDAIDYQED